MAIIAEQQRPSGLTLDASVWFFAGQLGESEPVRTVGIHKSPFRIGRKPDLELSLPCNSISKEHATIFDEDGRLFVRDMNSTNGTFVNGERIESTVELKEGDILQFATIVFRIGRQAPESTDTGTIAEDAGDRALAMMQFERLISERAVVPFYQPLVRVDDPDLSVVGYEVLGRSRMFGLRTPGEMFATASQLNLEAELSRIFRQRGLEAAVDLPPGSNLFVNTHPIELVEDGLAESLQLARKLHPDQLITLEIHEAAVTNPKLIRSLRAVLDDLDMQLAFDDFGAGQARLVELSEASPDYLKFDMGLVQGIAKAPPRRQQVLSMLTRMVKELGIIPLAEGVETQDDHETLRDMGFELGQGYFYGRPASIADQLKKLK